MDPHQAALVEAALREGIDVEDLSVRWGRDAVAYRRGERVEIVCEGKTFSHLSFHADLLGREKHIAKQVLAEIGIPSPAGIYLEDADASANEIREQLTRGPQVMKPSASEGGEGVRPGLTRIEDVRAHWQSFRERHAGFVLEDQIEGRDLRIQGLDGRLVAACLREPAYVMGDGLQSVDALVEARREEMWVQNPANRLDLDGESESLLGEQGLSRDAVPEAGLRVVLKRIGNLARGGVAVDVSDEIHARYAEWVAAIGARFGLRLFAVDVMTTDHRADPSAAARVIEINTRPDWLHHTFSERRTHDVPGMILRDLFSRD